LNDRELLESAARAARFEFEWADPLYGGRDTPMADGIIWNPLDSDSDAFRLAIEIGLIVNAPSPIGEYAIVKFYDIDVWERVSDCRYAATRRAIVRAAAEIGSRVDAQPESVG